MNKVLIDHVPADFPVGFCLLSTETVHYIAYYNADHEMVIVQRDINTEKSVTKIVPTKIGCDSHNYVTLALDKDGHLHVSGNMHCVPLIYFRTQIAGDISSLEKAEMTGLIEDGVTYPVFFKTSEGDLVFTYRDGGSGCGSNYFNRYDCETTTWSRLVDGKIFDGDGKCNGYMIAPSKGPDGYFHVYGVWRDTPACETNHDLTYIRSKDLLNWENAFGEKQELPVNSDSSTCFVDPIPAEGGIINGCIKHVFDQQDRIHLLYHKSDANGYMQIYVARIENDAWRIEQVSNFSDRIWFEGYGSMGFIGITLDKFEIIDDHLVIQYHHKTEGYGLITLDKNLNPQPHIKGDEAEAPILPKSNFPGMQVRRCNDRSTNSAYLQWETLSQNRDQQREGDLPDPSPLYLIEE